MNRWSFIVLSPMVVLLAAWWIGCSEPKEDPEVLAEQAEIERRINAAYAREAERFAVKLRDRLPESAQTGEVWDRATAAMAEGDAAVQAGMFSEAEAHYRRAYDLYESLKPPE